MTFVRLVVPRARDLAGMRDTVGAPLRYTFAAFLFEYLFSRPSDAGLEAHPAWRQSAEWIAAYLRLVATFAEIDDGHEVDLEEADHAKLWTVAQSVSVPAVIHADLAHFFLAVACGERVEVDLDPAVVDEAVRRAVRNEFERPSAPSAPPVDDEEQFTPPA